MLVCYSKKVCTLCFLLSTDVTKWKQKITQLCKLHAGKPCRPPPLAAIPMAHGMGTDETHIELHPNREKLHCMFMPISDRIQHVR